MCWKYLLLSALLSVSLSAGTQFGGSSTAAADDDGKLGWVHGRLVHCSYIVDIYKDQACIIHNQCLLFLPNNVARTYVGKFAPRVAFVYSSLHQCLVIVGNLLILH